MEEIWERSLSPERKAFLAQSRIPEIILCNVILLVIATAGLAVRLFVRMRYLTGVNFDDLLCVTSWVCRYFLLYPISDLFAHAGRLVHVFTVVLCVTCMESKSVCDEEVTSYRYND